MSDTSFKVKNGLVVNNSLLIADPSTSRVGINTSTPGVTFEINATDAMLVPSGNTGQRPAGANGHLRYNSQTAGFEGFANGSWGSIAGASISIGGANTQIQFNDSSALGASGGLTFNKTSNTLFVGNTLTIGAGFTANASAFSMFSGFFQGNTTAGVVGNWTTNTTAKFIGNTTVNTVITSGTIQLGGATVNSTVYTGSVSTALTANNATNLNGSAASAYLAFGNFTGVISTAQLGTGATPQFASGGVGVGNPGGSAWYVAGEIYSYSQLRTAGNVIANSSDRRLKHKVAPLENSLYKIKQLHGITYEFNELAHQLGSKLYDRQIGLFADEVEAVVPEAAAPSPLDTDVEGKSITGKNYKTIMYDRLVPLLVEAIKELTAKVEYLEGKL